MPDWLKLYSGKSANILFELGDRPFVRDFGLQIRDDSTQSEWIVRHRMAEIVPPTPDLN